MSKSKIKFYNSLSGKMLVFAVLPTVIILSGVIAYTALNMFTTVREEVENSLKNLAVVS
jgi:hypothetical protein